MTRGIWAVLAATACLAGTATSALATPVATNDAEYDALGRVFPDPLAGCQRAGTSPCDPAAQGNVPATQFIGVDEFRDALGFMNRNPAWQPYMEVWALDGQLDGQPTDNPGEMFPGNNLAPEFDPRREYVSAGLPTTDVGRRKSDLMVVRVTDERVPDANKKRYALSLSIHGIERAGAEGGTRAMEDLVTAATTGDRLNEPIVNDAVKPGAPSYAEILRESIIYFTYPNPDGWRRGSVSEGGVFFQRYNGNGVDPNRDWPDIGFSFRPYSSVSEPETHAWINFYNDIQRKTGDRFAAGDDLHGQPEADALSYTLIPHGRKRFDKNQRIQLASKRINRGTYEAIKWSPIVQDNDQPQGGGPGCVPGALGDVCAKIYAQTWGTVYDTINYTTTGALGDWFDSTIGLNADGIDNEMSFSHLDKNIVFEPQTEQLHVDGNRALIFARVAELVDPSHDQVFSARGRKGYVPNERVAAPEQRNQPEAPPGTRPQTAIDEVTPTPGGGTFDFDVERSAEVYNGGMRVEVTTNNALGVGTGTATLKVQCKGCDQHPGVEASDEYITVAEDYNQSPAYAQAGLVATVNDPQPSRKDEVQWRAVVEGLEGVAPGPTAVSRFHIEFTSGPASSDGDTGGGAPPVQSAYDVANTDFFRDLNPFSPGRAEDLRRINPKAVIAGRQKLNRFDTIALADDPLPGYTGKYGRKTPTGPPTANQTIDGSSSAPGGGQTAPGTFEEREFTIGDNDSNKSAKVTVEWDTGANDFDLSVFREEADGERTLVGRSAGGVPDTSESVTLEEPLPAKYIVRVENFASPDPRWRGTIEFEAAETTSGTGDYTETQKNAWFRALRRWTSRGGNLVLTDGALRALGDVTPIPSTAVTRQTVYAGQSAFAKEEDEPTTEDPLARDVVQQGARFNTGMRRQMYEPTPLGFAIQDEDGSDAAFARQYDVDKVEWEKAGGRTVGTSADAGARDAQAVYERVTIGELPVGRGQVRIAGALLPTPTEEFDHQSGLEPYAVTYTGYVMARNLLDAPTPGVASARGNRFVIVTKKLRVRKGRRGNSRRRIARVKVRCRSRRGCYGKLKLQVRKRKRPGRRDQPEGTPSPNSGVDGGPSAAGSKRSRTVLVVIGRKRFAMKKSGTRVINVRLTLEGRRLQRRTKRVRTRGAAPVRFGRAGQGGRGTAVRPIILLRAKGDRQVLFARGRNKARGSEAAPAPAQ